MATNSRDPLHVTPQPASPLAKSSPAPPSMTAGSTDDSPTPVLAATPTPSATPVAGRTEYPPFHPDPSGTSLSSPAILERLRQVEDPRETAAKAILETLDPHLRTYATELAYLTLNIPLWALVASAVATLQEWGQLSGVMVPPSVRRQIDGWKSPVDGLASPDCEWCHEPFRPLRYKQRFCSQACGTAANAAVRASTPR